MRGPDAGQATLTAGDEIAEFRAALDNGFCGDRSSDLPLDEEFPPCVCVLPAGHSGMHRDGKCAWLRAPACSAVPGPEDAA